MTVPTISCCATIARRWRRCFSTSRAGAPRRAHHEHRRQFRRSPGHRAAPHRRDDPALLVFADLVLTSWSLGIFVSGLVLRNGLGAESIVWTLMFGILPLACVYYPVSVLPSWLQVVAWVLPPTYVFEGMRALLIDHVFRAELMVD